MAQEIAEVVDTVAQVAETNETPKPFRPFFVHLRLEDAEKRIAAHGGATLYFSPTTLTNLMQLSDGEVLEIPDDGYDVYVAECSPKDVYCKAVGRAKAEGRSRERTQEHLIGTVRRGENLTKRAIDLYFNWKKNRADVIAKTNRKKMARVLEDFSNRQRPRTVIEKGFVGVIL